MTTPPPAPLDHAVVIAGGGPTGMMLAAELTLAGTDVLVVERRATGDLDGSRAGGLHARTIEVLDQRGIADRFLAAGDVAQVQGFALIAIDISDFPSRHPYGLALWQTEFERILGERLAELEVPVLRGVEVVGLAQDADGVDVELSDGTIRRAGWLVGCDGGRSRVRKAAGIDFPGWDPSTSFLIAEVDVTEEPFQGIHRDAAGTHALNRRAPGEPMRVLIQEPPEEGRPAPDLDELRAAMVRVFGSDFGVHSPRWISRFTDMARQAASYRQGRVLLAGDAAHVHSPHGGQGLNIGVQDAVNLGWKLAQVVAGTSPEDLLDSYHAERHPIGARVLQWTMAQVALSGTDDRHLALKSTVTDLLALDQARVHMGGIASGLDVHYDLGGSHPLVGRRLPDLDLRVGGGDTRAFALLHEARPLLLNLGAPAAFDPSPWAPGVRSVDAVAAGPWELPVLGPVDAPPAVLVRPDGYVAWVGTLDDPDLPEALVRWFGRATPAA